MKKLTQTKRCIYEGMKEFVVMHSGDRYRVEHTGASWAVYQIGRTSTYKVGFVVGKKSDSCESIYRSWLDSQYE